MNHPWNRYALLASLACLPAGCSTQELAPDSAQAHTPTRIGKPLPSDVSSLFTHKDELVPVFFANGAWMLNAQTMQLMKENVDWLKRNMPLHILVAGYSDGRGTPEQNLAMGQRRAGALRDFYVSMGIPRSRISTVSYGQEEPVCFDATEECQAQNRRVDTLIENRDLASK